MIFILLRTQGEVRQSDSIICQSPFTFIVWKKMQWKSMVTETISPY